MPYRFDADTVLTPAGELSWTAEIRDGWVSLSGVPNGGFLMGLALRAAGAALPGVAPITATAHFLRPGLPGPARLDVEVVKRGRTTSVAAVRLVQDRKERVRVLTTLGGPDSGPPDSAPPAPPLPGPDELPEPGPEVAASASVRRRFDYRLAPVEGARIEGWIRFADGRPMDLAALPLVVDCFPPAVLGVLDGVAISTLELTVHLRRAPGPGWLQARIGSRALLNGLVEEDVELWDGSGQLVAMSRQLAQVVPAQDASR
jgi:acyl-CoA thioesterase